jgi:hypothetical protein
LERSRSENTKLLVLIIEILLVLLIGSFFVYRLRTPISNFVFYSFIFLGFLISKRIIFWTAILFIVLNTPWGLFYYVPYDWYFGLTTTVGISYVSLIGLIVFIKSLSIFRKKELRLKDMLSLFYKPVIYFTVFMLIWSLVYGHNLVSLYNIVQFFPSFLIFLVIPTIMDDNQLIKFNKIIFLFSIIHFLGSLAEIISPGSFMRLIFFGPPPTGVAYETGLIRFVGGIAIHLYTIIIALFYLSTRSASFKHWYLWLIVSLSYIFILSSATRGWMIASTFMLSGYFIYFVLRIKQSIKTFASVTLVILFVIVLIPDSLKTNINAAINRLETMKAITEGDLTAEGTLSRITERGPVVLTRFSESPVVGFGFSKVTAEFFDEHVGNHSILLMGGIIGLIIIWGSVLALTFFIFRVDFKNSGKGVFVIGLALLTIMIIHSTSRSMIAFYMPADSAFLVCLLINHYNALAQNMVKVKSAQNIPGKLRKKLTPGQ